MTRSVFAVAVGALLVSSLLTGNVSAAADPIKPAANSLPKPFSEWNVSLERVDGNSQVLSLEYDSPMLHRRTTNTVFLPDTYNPAGEKSPVMYYLHGTVMPQLDDPTLDPVTKQEYFIDMIASGGGNRQTDLFRFASNLDKAQFLMVAPDTDKKNSWCESCGWIDGRDDLLPNIPPATAETLPADSYLHQELYPLIEALFNVRTDRAGRGVTGFSMGGWGALTQGMKHPDKYAYVGSITGAYDILAPLVRTEFAEPVGYLRDQGYGTSMTHETWWRNFNPRDLATNLRGIDTHLLLSSGNACLQLDGVTEPDCRTDPALNTVAAEVEFALAQNYKLAVKDLKAKGIPVQTATSPGVHGSNNHQVYSDHVVPTANRVFSTGAEQPSMFSYRTANPQFSVWDYQVSADRPTPSFLEMTHAQTTGRAFTLSGIGQVDITTPPTFHPGETYTVMTAYQTGEQVQTFTKADRSGRLPVTVNLGDAVPGYERIATVEVLR